jgi:hypothetical protein
MFPNSPKLVKGGIVLMDTGTGAIQRVIALQYNPQTLSRTLQVQAAEIDGDGDRSEALRLTGPPIETIKLDAELDATDQLEKPRENRVAVEYGIQPQLAALETIIYPDSARLQQNLDQARGGVLEISPVEQPLTIWAWSRSRIAPVRITSFTIEEQLFDVNLNPIQARISLEMRVLSVNDLGFNHRGANLFMVYQRQKERLATLGPASDLRALGIEGIPT